jgi:hypothetical protein
MLGILWEWKKRVQEGPHLASKAILHLKVSNVGQSCIWLQSFHSYKVSIFAVNYVKFLIKDSFKVWIHGASAKYHICINRSEVFLLYLKQSPLFIVFVLLKILWRVTAAIFLSNTSLVGLYHSPLAQLIFPQSQSMFQLWPQGLL